MPNTTQTKQQAKALHHANRAIMAAEEIKAILSGSGNELLADPAAILLAAAKDLESAGCYIRRANANNQLGV